MKKLLLISLLLAGCTVTMQPNDDLVKVVDNQGRALQEIIKILQEKKIIESK